MNLFKTVCKYIALCLHAGYAEFALQASVLGCLAMVASLAWCVAAPSRQHSKPPISKYALIGPEQTSVINSKLAEASSLRHRAHSNGKLRQASALTSAMLPLKLIQVPMFYTAWTNEHQHNTKDHSKSAGHSLANSCMVSIYACQCTP